MQAMISKSVSVWPSPQSKVLGILIFLALIYIFYSCFHNRKSGKEIISLDEVVIDDIGGDRADR